MLNLAGLTPIGVRYTPEGPRLQWRVEGRIIETNADRFRPVQIVKAPDSGDIRVVWRDFYDLPMTDPFFHAAQEFATAMPERTGLFQTDLDVVHRVAHLPDTLPFSGAIFHMARTGSTLVHRLLSQSGKVMSLSEVPMVNQALARAVGLPEAHRGDALRSIVGAYGRARRPSEEHMVIKMQDAMPSKQLPVFRAAFPETPWIFIYRDPVEVMVSLLRKPSGTIQQWFRNRAAASRNLGMPALADGAMWPEEYIARTLHRYCASAVETAKASPPGRFLAVSYRRLPDAVWETIGPHFGIEFTEKDREVMRAAAKYSSKATEVVEFKPDSSAKLDEAGPKVRALAERWVAPVIRQLESLPQG
jgi:Sulfotransferase family